MCSTDSQRHRPQSSFSFLLQPSQDTEPLVTPECHLEEQDMALTQPLRRTQILRRCSDPSLGATRGPEHPDPCASSNLLASQDSSAGLHRTPSHPTGRPRSRPGGCPASLSGLPYYLGLIPAFTLVHTTACEGPRARPDSNPITWRPRDLGSRGPLPRPPPKAVFLSSSG